MNLTRPEVNPALKGFSALVDRVTVRVSRVRREEMFFTKAIACALVEEFVREVGDVALKDGRCEVPGLGVVYRSTHKVRNISNPITKKPMSIPAQWSLKLRAAKSRKGPARSP